MSMKEKTWESKRLALWVLYFNIMHRMVLTNTLMFKSHLVPFISKICKISEPFSF